MQYIGFMLCEREFAVDILSVQEIIRDVELTGVPQSEAGMSGIFNLRGKVIPVMDLRQRLSLSGCTSDRTNILVVRQDQNVVGIRVDEITGALSIPEDRIEAFGNLGDSSAPADTMRVARLEDRLILVPDLSRLMGIKPETPEEPVPMERNVFSDGLSAVQEELLAKAEPGGRNEEDIRRIIGEIQHLMNGLVGGDLSEAESAIDAITALSEKKLFSEVGSITRKLHDSLKEFRKALDPKIKAFATRDMPEAADNLEHVIALTDQAANKTISIVERGLEEDDWMRGRLEEMDRHMAALRDAGANGEALAALESLRQDLSGYADRSSDGYNQILMSQDFQDLTGQMIRRIIKLVRELESQLVSLIQNFGIEIKVETAEVREELKGPASETRVAQQGVDDLLSSFGF